MNTLTNLRTQLDELENEMDSLATEEHEHRAAATASLEGRVARWQTQASVMCAQLDILGRELPPHGKGAKSLRGVTRQLDELSKWPRVRTFCGRFREQLDEIRSGLGRIAA